VLQVEPQVYLLHGEPQSLYHIYLETIEFDALVVVVVVVVNIVYVTLIVVDSVVVVVKKIQKMWLMVMYKKLGHDMDVRVEHKKWGLDDSKGDTSWKEQKSRQKMYVTLYIHFQ